MSELYVCWDKNTEEDLCDGADAHGTPYAVFISDFEPSGIEEMELAMPVAASMTL